MSMSGLCLSRTAVSYQMSIRCVLALGRAGCARRPQWGELGHARSLRGSAACRLCKSVRSFYVRSHSSSNRLKRQRTRLGFVPLRVPLGCALGEVDLHHLSTDVPLIARARAWTCENALPRTRVAGPATSCRLTEAASPAWRAWMASEQQADDEEAADQERPCGARH